MNFNTANNTFRQLLGNGLSHHVPPFQRDYSWTDEEWDDIWQDMLNLSEPDGEPAHYMGYLVLQSSDSKRFAIIDGQQRLTTLSVLVLVCSSWKEGDVLTTNHDMLTLAAKLGFNISTGGQDPDVVHVVLRL